MAEKNLKKGQEVTVVREEPLENKRAIVVKVPPFTDRLGNDHDDSAMVKYPGSTSRIALMGDMHERIPLEQIVVE